MTRRQPDMPGDAWERKTLTPIRRAAQLPLVSVKTEREPEGHVFREWRTPPQRSSSIPRRRFIAPAIAHKNPSRYHQTPDVLHRLDIRHAPAGDADAHPSATLTERIRAMPWAVAP